MNSEKNLKGKSAEKKKKQSNLFYDFVKLTGAPVAFVWMRPKIYRLGGPVPKGAVLVCANHGDFVDPITVHLALPTRRLHCLATKDLYTSKLRTKFFNACHCIMVDKQNFSISSFHTVIDLLKDGKAVVIFPEGQVNRQEEKGLLTFKSGAILMAHKSGAPILPIYIAKCEKWYHRRRIMIGAPIDIKTLVGEVPTMEEVNRASEYLREREIELRTYYETNILKNKD